MLDKGQADVAIVFTTDGQLAARQVRRARRTTRSVPALQHQLRRARPGAEEAGADVQKTIDDVQKGMTQDIMQELNARVDLDKQTPKAVAAST